MRDVDAKFKYHHATYFESVERAIDKVTQKAFPGGDAEGHCSSHKALIAKAEARTKFYNKLTFELTRGGLFAFAGWVLYALWKAFLLGPK